MSVVVEVTNIDALVLNKQYFSRSAGYSFVVLKKDSDTNTISIGIRGRINRLSYVAFKKQYFAQGIIED